LGQAGLSDDYLGLVGITLDSDEGGADAVIRLVEVFA
jgi:hypothetical protein